MTKRLFDIAVSLVALSLLWPLLAIIAFAIWCQDGRSPFYLSFRVGRGNRDFRMLKLRTMAVGADRLGGPSTAASDSRVTPLGSALRRFKVDELPQFWNVLKGDMSVVGPRPNLRHGGVDRYTVEERRLLSVSPGVTDLASIVFSDEGEILKDSPDPDALYDSVIRPWKNRLGLFYIDNGSLLLDIRLIWVTAVAICSKTKALRQVIRMLDSLGAEQELQRICCRDEPLPHGLPPGHQAQLATP